MDVQDFERQVGFAVNFLKALANDKRLLIICNLLHEEKNVGELERLVGLSQSALSQHLARLRKDGLVKTRRNAQTIYYSSDDPKVHALVNCLGGIFDFASPDGQNAKPHAQDAKPHAQAGQNADSGSEENGAGRDPE